MKIFWCAVIALLTFSMSTYSMKYAAMDQKKLAQKKEAAILEIVDNGTHQAKFLRACLNPEKEPENFIILAHEAGITKENSGIRKPMEAHFSKKYYSSKKKKRMNKIGVDSFIPVELFQAGKLQRQQGGNNISWTLRELDMINAFMELGINGEEFSILCAIITQDLVNQAKQKSARRCVLY